MTEFELNAHTSRTDRGAALVDYLGGYRRHPMECVARLLEKSGSFKVLRRLDVPLTPLPCALDARLALFVDVETTGLDWRNDEIIQAAVVPFQHTDEGQIVAVHEPLDQLRDPGRTIPPEVTELTGIDDAMVRGRVLDEVAIKDLLRRANMVVAHNAGFDRRFLERLMPEFAALPWACSMADVPWREEGFTTLKLPVLAAEAGFFYDAHRAADDCLAAVELLRRPLQRTGRIAMAELLRSATRETVRVTAARAPFDRKDLLKQRRYRWTESAELEGQKAWAIEIAAESLADELRFLRESVYGAYVDLPTTRISAFERYSSRA